MPCLQRPTFFTPKKLHRKAPSFYSGSRIQGPPPAACGSIFSTQALGSVRFSSFAYSQEAGAVLSAHATAVNSLSSVSISSHRQLIFLYLTEHIGTGKLTYHRWVFVSLCHVAVIVGGPAVLTYQSVNVIGSFLLCFCKSHPTTSKVKRVVPGGKMTRCHQSLD